MIGAGISMPASMPLMIRWTSLLNGSPPLYWMICFKVQLGSRELVFSRSFQSSGLRFSSLAIL